MIRELVAEFRGTSRAVLASTICEWPGWRRQNRKLRTVELYGSFFKNEKVWLEKISKSGRKWGKVDSGAWNWM